MSGGLFKITVSTSDLDPAIRNATAMAFRLGARSQLNARIASGALQLTQNYLRADTGHRTADKLGARPTNWRSKTARAIEAASDDHAAILRIPRWTGLARAFTDFNLSPTGGRVWLTIPANSRTYGKRVGDFPQGTFKFALEGGRFPALVFATRHKGAQPDEVAFWLRRSVTIKQDRTLLPSEDAFLQLAGTVSNSYLRSLLAGGSDAAPSS